MKSSRPASAHCTSSKSSTVGNVSASRSKRIRQAEKRFSSSPGIPSSRPSRCAMRGSHPGALLRVRQVLLERARRASRRRRRHPRPRRSRSACAPSPPAPSTRRPRRTRGSGRGARTHLPARPSMYFSNSHASRDLPIPAIPETSTSWARLSSSEAWKRSLTSCSSRFRPTNGASSPAERIEPPRPATTRSARQSCTGSVLPFISCRPASSYAIVASVARFVASPVSTVPGSAADWIRDAVLTRSPATIPWFVAPSVTAASPVRIPARARSSGSSSGIAAREVERGPDGALGVVLLSDRNAPDRHHRVADELLDDPPVAGDHGARGLEVPAQELAHLLGVTLFGERGERPRGRGTGPTRAAARWPASRRAACASGSAAPVAVSTSTAPHSPQNFTVGGVR